MIGQIKGTGVALVTPFTENLVIDFDALGKIIEYTIEGDVDFFVILGTTGESPVLSWGEKLEVLSYVIDKNNGRKPLVFGLGGNNTSELIEKSNELRDTEIDAILSVNPYYNKPSQAGIERHFNLLADAFPKPIILYNVPHRTASNIEANTTLKLSRHANIMGIKEASGDLTQCEQIIKEKPDDFIVLSGEDSLTRQLINIGATGVISVVGNILPAEFSSMVNQALAGNNAAAKELNEKLKSAYELLSREGNPSSLKSGLKAKLLCEKYVRPPLFEASSGLESSWRDLIAHF